jgi:hypothetical protein
MNQQINQHDLFRDIDKVAIKLVSNPRYINIPKSDKQYNRLSKYESILSNRMYIPYDDLTNEQLEKLHDINFFK